LVPSVIHDAFGVNAIAAEAADDCGEGVDADGGGESAGGGASVGGRASAGGGAKAGDAGADRPGVVLVIVAAGAGVNRGGGVNTGGNDDVAGDGDGLNTGGREVGGADARGDTGRCSDAATEACDACC
jgi:hypothetical protein